MKQQKAQILSHQPISDDYHQMSFSLAAGDSNPLPGQFFTLRVSEEVAPLLRRPFAFSGYDAAKGRASFIYQRRGRATALLAARREGEIIDVIAPLGRAFPWPAQGAPCTLVGGGIGLGPLLFLARELLVKANPLRLVLGYRSAAHIPERSIFEGLEVDFCTDDGSEGFRGNAVACFASRAAQAGEVIYACGPEPMLAGCSRLAEERGAPCWVSVEQVMACGVGACMGCVVKVRREPGYARACSEGPVFDSREIVWN
ncbi:MAG: dihydroorotate dehydrogenase electron transfer subunit [Planctomycetes bacterium]|nr:dihydroorotate dehydrogenase electron transfer subunit [Planctomycetota bacterium]